ncbi:MAG: hypothetical protein WC560_12825, partial [Syntrophales bacterium]
MVFTTEDLRSGQLIRITGMVDRYHFAVIREVGVHGLHLTFNGGYHQYCTWEWLPQLQVNIDGLY